MTATEQLRLATYMNKRAINWGGINVGQGSTFNNIGSMLPGVGAGFSAANAMHDFAGGRILSGIGNTAMAGASLVPGAGLLGAGAKGIGKGLAWGAGKLGMGAFGKTIGRGIGTAGIQVGNTMSRMAGAIPGVKALRKSDPVQWINKNPWKTTAGIYASGAGMGRSGGAVGAASSPLTENLMGGLNSLGSNPGMATKMLGGESNPAWIRPPETGALPTQMLSRLTS